MKRLPKKNIDTQPSVVTVSKKRPDTTQKRLATLPKKSIKKSKKERNSTPINADLENILKGLKSDIKGMKNPQKYLDFIGWMSRPLKKGDSLNQEEFAQEIGVDETTLSRWKKRVGFWEDVFMIRREWARGKSTTVLNAVLRTILTDARAPEAKLWLQYTGELLDQSKVNLGVDPEIQAALDKFAKLLP